jgi:hypothetical protein
VRENFESEEGECMNKTAARISTLIPSAASVSSPRADLQISYVRGSRVMRSKMPPPEQERNKTSGWRAECQHRLMHLLCLCIHVEGALSNFPRALFARNLLAKINHPASQSLVQRLLGNSLFSGSLRPN